MLVEYDNKTYEVLDVCEAWDRDMKRNKNAGMLEGIIAGEIEGEKKGIMIGRKKLNKLIEWLFHDNRQNEVYRCVTDKDYQDDLLQEYGYWLEKNLIDKKQEGEVGE